MINLLLMETFSLIIGLGVVLGFSLAVSGKKETLALRVIDSGLGFLLGGLVGSRMLYVAVHWSYYQAHLAEILQVWSGGYSAIGGIVGVFLVWLILFGFRLPDHAVLADHFVSVLMMVTITAWLGSWMVGVAYGPRLTGEGWGILTRDEWGSYTKRFPTQLLGAFLTWGWFWLLERSQRKRKHALGWLATRGLCGISILFTGLSLLRADSSLLWKGLRLDTWGGIGLILLSLLMIYFHRRFTQS